MALTDHPEFGPWARRAVAGLKDSHVMVGMLDASDLSDARYEFQLQIGHCLVTDKPVVLIVPHGTNVPAKLLAAATVVERYTLGDLASAQAATTRALEAVGVERAH
jgi:hypothetical protein